MFENETNWFVAAIILLKYNALKFSILGVTFCGTSDDFIDFISIKNWITLLDYMYLSYIKFVIGIGNSASVNGLEWSGVVVLVVCGNFTDCLW